MNMNRRKFLNIASTGAALLPFSPLLFAGQQKKYASDIVTLGNTGIQASRLAMGTGTHGVNKSSNQTRQLGVRGVAKLLASAYEQGINFWDSADQYGTHPHLNAGLKLVPREKVVILTKSHATTAKEMRSDIERFLREVGTDYLDIVLLHLMTEANWPELKAGAMEELSKMREEGLVRAHGVSCHTLNALKTASETDWVQVDLARINPEGARMDDTVDKVVPVLQKMHANGKAVLGMKIFGGGKLTSQPDECLKFILNQEYVDAFTIGQENEKEMLDLVARIPKMSISA